VWWQYQRARPALTKAIEGNERIIVITKVSKYLIFSLIENERQVITNGVIVFTAADFKVYSILNSSYHTEWAATYGSTLESRFRYTPSDCFETFPFPQNLNSKQEEELEKIGEAYHEYRKQLMLGMQLGLTKTYNLFHSAGIKNETIDEKEKQVIALRKHLDKTEDTISFEKSIEGIIKLRELHVQMDNAVLNAYGWSKVELRHDFYEVDYLPENDRVRFTIHPEARKEILKRLLELNHKIHDEEVKTGLWDKKKAVSKKFESLEVKEPETGYGLFDKEK